ncbi:MAG TPA: CheR family methyltransferase, partial [Candidatus Aquilonibacter sp.]|nr:CheR family methyltransferase [Candidatus Aquilonibacter sp.]
MHKMTATSTILEHELSEVRLLVERQTGVVLDCPNSALAAHVAESVESHGLGSAGAWLERLRSTEQDPANLPRLLDGLINTRSGFFRHPTAMNALARQVLPQLQARKSADGTCPLRIWSAGCSTGEEAYSVAMAVCDAANANGANGLPTSGRVATGNGVASASPSAKEKNGNSRNGGVAETPLPGLLQGGPNLAGGCGVHIVGSDLLPSNIEAAERGIYPQSALAGLPPATIRAYFSKIGSPNVVTAANNGSADGAESPANGSGGGTQSTSVSNLHLLVKPRLRSLITFNCMNLARPGYIGRFDCIFCMDVLPHFSRAQRIAVMERLHLYLEPGGYLFLSQTEKLCAPNLN